MLPGCSFLHRSRPQLACPRTAIINELASEERYRPGAPATPENLAYRAALQNITGTCSTAGQDVNVQVSVELVVEPGPAFAGPEVEVPYLVSVLGPGGGVLDRRDYVAKVTVAPGTRRGGTRELLPALGRDRPDQGLRLRGPVRLRPAARRGRTAGAEGLMRFAGTAR